MFLTVVAPMLSFSMGRTSDKTESKLHKFYPVTGQNAAEDHSVV